MTTLRLHRLLRRRATVPAAPSMRLAVPPAVALALREGRVLLIVTDPRRTEK